VAFIVLSPKTFNFGINGQRDALVLRPYQFQLRQLRLGNYALKKVDSTTIVQFEQDGSLSSASRFR